MFLETALVIAVAAFAAGVVACAIYAELLVIRPLERHIRDRSLRDLRAARQRQYRQNARLEHLAEVVHLGTPYLPETVRHATIPHVVATGKPGLRIVNGEPTYSADWLNDDAAVNP